jgi:hypothetical protein
MKHRRHSKPIRLKRQVLSECGFLRLGGPGQLPRIPFVGRYGTRSPGAVFRGPTDDSELGLCNLYDGRDI